MDVLIKNMEMPKNCDDCFFYTRGNTFSRNKCFLLKENPWSPLWDGDVPPSCPLVELPPHGELIERSKVHEAITQAYCLEDVPSIIDQLVPTVVEAST